MKRLSLKIHYRFSKMLGTVDPIEASRRFWDAKARENAPWYVSSFIDYDHPDMAGFWASGSRIWTDLKSALRYEPAPGDVVVEVGCGMGRLTRAIANDVKHVHAFDISEAMLELARAHNLNNATFYRGEGISLRPVEDGIADATIAYCVFQHLPHIPALELYIRELCRVTRPGGVIAFTLSPPEWKDGLAPLLTPLQWLREHFKGGPTGLYRREWLGIRPSVGRVLALSPINLQHSMLHGDKLLFWGSLVSSGQACDR